MRELASVLVALASAALGTAPTGEAPSPTTSTSQPRGCSLPATGQTPVPIPVGKDAGRLLDGQKPPAAGSFLRPVADVPLPGRPVRFDYQSQDPGTGRLFVSHMHDAHVVVFDTRASRVVGQVAETPGVTGVWVVPELRKVYASVTGRHYVAVIDADSLHVRATLGPIEFPDGIAYAASARRIFVSDESGGGELVIDAIADRVVGKVGLGGEAGNTKYDEGSGCILVAVQTLNEIVAIDPLSLAIVSRFQLAQASHPHGMYVDGRDRLLFVANQGNATVQVVDLRSLQVTDIVKVGDDPDVLAFDPQANHLYVATEGGGLWVYHLRGKRLVVDGTLDIPHAHTVSVDPSTHRVYLPLESLGGRPVLRVLQGPSAPQP